MINDIGYNDLAIKFPYAFIIMPHQGLGDHIITNGLIRRIHKNLSNIQRDRFIMRFFSKLLTPQLLRARSNLNNEWSEKIFLLCKQSKFHLVSYMYRDNSDIVVVKFSDENESAIAKHQLMNPFAITLGCWSHLPFEAKSKTFDVGFYDQAQLEFRTRFDDFYIERDLKAEQRTLEKYNINGDCEYIFVHEDLDRGFLMDVKKYRNDLQIVRNNKEDNFFNYGSLFEGAAELHLMPSGIYDYCNSLPIIRGNIFLHRYMRDLSPFLVAETNHQVTQIF